MFSLFIVTRHCGAFEAKVDANCANVVFIVVVVVFFSPYGCRILAFSMRKCIRNQ